MKYKIKAFTLTELLIALGIIGAIAAISIPSLMNTINNRLLTTQIKSNVAAIQQLASDSLVVNKVKNLDDTDFGNPNDLLREGNFSVAKNCANPAKECWKTAEDSTNRVKYTSLNKTDVTVVATRKTIVLQNGAVLSYATTDIAIPNDKVIGIFDIDVNGNDYPNIWGRDFVSFWVTQKGKIVTKSTVYKKTNMTLDEKIANCKAGDGGYCLDAIIESGWTMPY